MKTSKKEREQMKKYYITNKLAIQSRKHKHFLEHRQKYYKKQREWYQKNKYEVNKKRRTLYPMKKEKINMYNQNWYNKNKQLVFDHYGRICKCCGETEEVFLSIDHINGGGNKHRQTLRKNGHQSGVSFYVWLVKNKFPLEFQTLCMNCQFGKRYGNVCPHQLKKKH